MRLLRGQTGTFKEDIQLETSCAKLAISVSSASGAFATESVYDKMRIQVDLHSRNRGAIQIIPKMALREALNIAAIKEGFFVKSDNLVKGSLNIGLNGAIQLQNGDYLSVSYDNFPADAVTDLFSIDVFVSTALFSSIEEQTINGTARDLNVADCTDIFFPITDADGNGIETIAVQYANKTVTYSADEIAIINDTVNDVVVVESEKSDSTPEVTFGYDKLLWLNIANAYRLTITPLTKVGTTIFLSRTKTV